MPEVDEDIDAAAFRPIAPHRSSWTRTSNGFMNLPLMGDDDAAPCWPRGVGTDDGGDDIEEPNGKFENGAVLTKEEGENDEDGVEAALPSKAGEEEEESFNLGGAGKRLLRW